VASPFSIRAYRAEDRQRVREICVETAWIGEPADGRIPSAFFWAELMTGYFTDVEPEHALVAVRSDASVRPVGYLLGTADAGRLEARRLRTLPRLLAHAIGGLLLVKPSARKVLTSMTRALARGELFAPRRVSERFPCTFELAIAREARDHGLGALLLDRFLTEMRALRRPGVHVQATNINLPVLKIIQRAGFQLAAEWPLTAFEGAGERGLSLLTWALTL
jgi:GNAT superfamily N-acetyltransferase